MNLPEFGVRRPVTNLMIFFSILLLAFYSMTRLGLDMMPEIEPPIVSVIAVYPGASPEDVEIRVTEPLENQLATTPGVEKIMSRSMEGISVISIKFKWGTNLDEATNDMRDRVDLAKPFLPDIPDELQNPFLFKFNTANIPVMFFGITADRSYGELYDLIDKQLGDAFKQIPGVGTVQLMGGLERQVNVWIDRERLEGYGFSIVDVLTRLNKENITQPVGNIKSGLTDYLLRLPGEFAHPDEMDQVILGQRDGKVVYLKDVARVDDSFKEKKTIVRIDEKPGLLMMIQKQTGTNTVEVSDRIKKRLVQIKPSLPSDVEITTIFDTSHDILNSLKTLKTSTWLAIVLVVLVVWFFLRQVASSVIIALTIPFSLLVTFIYLFLSGRTVNTISLSSIAIASGMVVDNAIVIVDNIYRRLERGNRPTEAAIFGANEMFLSVGASTLTTIVVFAPMLFIPGVVGIFFGELAAIVIATLAASLFTSVTFSPMLASMWVRVEHGGKGKASHVFRGLYDTSERWFRRVEDRYARLLGWCLRHKKTVIIGFTGVFIVSLIMARGLESEFAPEEDSGDVRLSVHLPIGTRVEETDKVARRIEGIMKAEIPERRYMFSRSGEVAGIGRTTGQASGTHIIAAGVKLVPKDQRKRSVMEVGNALRTRILAIPGVMKLDVSTGSPIGQLVTGTGGKAIQLEIVGHSFEETDALAARIKTAVEKIPGVVDAAVSRELNRPEYKIEVDREKSGALGLDMNSIAYAVKTFMEGSVATRYREKGKSYDIVVRLEEESRSKIEDVENLFITSPVTGRAVKLGNIARIGEIRGPEEIERLNRERVVKVSCGTFGRAIGNVASDIRKEIDRMVIPPGILINIGGEIEEMQNSMRDLLLLLLLGMALVYMVMAAQFESFLDPFIIMLAVPFTFSGVIFVLLITGITVSILSVFGVVMLMGIVVNNAIVLVSYINILRARGYSIYDAITLGGKDRLRPVLMTTITTLAGLMPLAFSRGEGSETWQPLGMTMVGGLSVSTFVTMLFVPTLYAIFEERVKAKKSGVKK